MLGIDAKPEIIDGKAMSRNGKEYAAAQHIVDEFLKFEKNFFEQSGKRTRKRNKTLRKTILLTTYPSHCVAAVRVGSDPVRLQHSPHKRWQGPAEQPKFYYE